MSKQPIQVSAQIVGIKEFKRQLEKLDDAAAERALVTAAKAGALPIRNEAAERAPKRTRTLARSIHIEVLESSRYRCVVAIGTNLEYAAIHEFGGVILPKNARFLAIPVGTLVGSPRLHDLHVARTRGGTYLLMDQAGNVQYLLRRSVTIPARPYMRPALDTKKGEALSEMAATLKQALERAL